MYACRANGERKALVGGLPGFTVALWFNDDALLSVKPISLWLKNATSQIKSNCGTASY